MDRISAAVAGFFIAWIASLWLASSASKINRQAESNIDEKSAMLLIRTDLGSVVVLIAITNALLGAILAAVILPQLK
jgi:biotin transporter BioY